MDEKLSLDELRVQHPPFDQESPVNWSLGGTAPCAVREQILQARSAVEFIVRP
ncbi:MAG: hypothetical protein HC902_08400 [Calothrix sp. SM1_5_4]|nr:hypothetical protein [Calothrix sp. SM1_5_4]